MYYITNRKPKFTEYGNMVDFKRYKGTSIPILKTGKIRSLKVYGKTIQDSSDLSIIESVAEREKEDNLYPIILGQNKINLPQPLRSLPNGVKNSIEMVNGILTHVQRVEKITFDGSNDEVWGNGYGSGDGKNNRFEIEIKYEGSYNLYYSINCVPSICDLFTTEITRAIPNVGCYRASFNNTTGLIYFLFNPDTNIIPLEDITAWRTWLQQNPVTLYYELATPVYTPIEEVTIIDLPQPLRSLPNSVRDTIKGNKLIQNIYELKLDNNFNFAVSVTLGSVLTDSTLFRFDIKLKYSSITGDINSIISNKFPYLFIHGINGGATKVTQECVSNHSANKGMVSVIIKKERLNSDDVNGFKEWCIANNFKILYQLETPIVHNLSIPPLNVNKGDIITTYNNIQPVLEFKV